MDILDQFDSSKFTLGDICQNGHDYQGTGKSLRRIIGGGCKECGRQRYLLNKESINEKRRLRYAQDQAFADECKDRARRNWQKKERKRDRKLEENKQKAIEWRSLYPEKHKALSSLNIEQYGFQLGTLCSNGHEYKDSSMSLKSRFGCVQCRQDRLDVDGCYICKEPFHVKTKPARPRILDGEYRYICNDCIKSVNKKCCTICNTEKPIEKFSLYKRTRDGHHSICKECFSVVSKTYSHTSLDRVKETRNARKKRAVMYSDGSLTKKHIKQILDEAKRCIYCNVSLNANNKSIDHIIPLSLGGSNSAANVVVCCFSCNTSKGSRPFSEWVERLSPRQQRKAESLYRERHSSAPTQLHLSLVYNDEPDFDYTCSVCSTQIVGEFPVKRFVGGKKAYVCASCTKSLKTKVCTKCKEEKPIEDFRLDKRKRDGRESRCILCRKEDATKIRRRKGIRPISEIQRTTKPRLNLLEGFVGKIDGVEEMVSSGLFYLGSECPNGHRWEDTEYSLRYYSNSHCTECSKQWAAEYQERKDYMRWLKKGSNAKPVAQLVKNEEERYRKQNRYRCDPEFREMQKKRDRDRYEANKEREKLRSKIWKRSNSHKNLSYNRKRYKWISESPGGCVTPELRRQILDSSSVCAYCDTEISKENAIINHIIPFSKGGSHSAHNLVACCVTCNARKRGTAFKDWVEYLSPENKVKAMSLYRERYGQEDW